MEEKKTKLTEFREIIEDIFANKLSVMKLSVVEFLSLFFASIFSMILVATVILIALLFGAVALSIFLNSLYGSTYLGYLTVSGALVFTLFILTYLMSRRGYPFFTDTFVKLFVKLFYADNEKN